MALFGVLKLGVNMRSILKCGFDGNMLRQTEVNNIFSIVVLFQGMLKQGTPHASPVTLIMLLRSHYSLSNPKHNCDGVLPPPAFP